MKKNNFYRISRWCKFFFKEDMVALYHTLTLAVIYMPREKGFSLKSKVSKVITKRDLISLVGVKNINLLIQERLIINSKEDEIEELYSLREKLVKNIKPDLMYLILANDCNLACGYCFEDTPLVKDDFKAQRMSAETAVAAVDYFARLTAKHSKKNGKKVIHFYGGEPLLNFKTVKAAVSRINELKASGELSKKCSLVIVTNGLLLTKEVAKYLSANNVTIGLSIDGPEEINNEFRLAKNKKINVFNRVMRAYKLAIENGASVGLSVTLTPGGIDRAKQMLKFFHENMSEKDGISFNILHYTPKVTVGIDYFNKVAKFLIKAFEDFRQQGVYEELMMRKVKSFVNQQPMYADCGVVGSQIVVAPDGQIGVCQDFIKSKDYFGGYVHDKDYDAVEAGLFTGWKNRSPMTMKECLNCEALAICGGGCPASTELRTSDRFNIDERICPHSKKTLKWLIWDSYRMLSNS